MNWIKVQETNKRIHYLNLEGLNVISLKDWGGGTEAHVRFGEDHAVFYLSKAQWKKIRSALKKKYGTE